MALEAIKYDDIRGTRLLTQEDLNLRIQSVAEEVLGAAEAQSPDEPMQPRIISASELVRRMQPFLVYN